MSMTWCLDEGMILLVFNHFIIISGAFRQFYALGDDWNSIE